MTDTTPTTVVDLSTHDLHLDPGGAVLADERRFEDGDPGRRTAAIFRTETGDDAHADMWERHPHGDEVVCCLAGGVRLHLLADGPGAPDDVVALGPGQVAIVARGRWHRMAVDGPTDILAVTVRHGTRLAADPRRPEGRA